MVVNEDMKKYKVIVNPMKKFWRRRKEIAGYDYHEKMKCDRKGDKDSRNYKMMKDKKY